MKIEPWHWAVLALGVGAVALGSSSSGGGSYRRRQDGVLVPDRMTRLSVEEGAAALAAAFEAVIGRRPTAAQLSLLLAHARLETGHFRSMHGFNFGNIKRGGSSWKGDWQMFRLNENIGGKLVWFDPPDPQTHMRAYRDAVEGASDYVAFLALASRPPKPNRYAKAWDALLSGDPAAFSWELKAAGYYTAGERAYTAGIVRLAEQDRDLVERIA